MYFYITFFASNEFYNTTHQLMGCRLIGQDGGLWTHQCEFNSRRPNPERIWPREWGLVVCMGEKGGKEF